MRDLNTYAYNISRKNTRKIMNNNYIQQSKEIYENALVEYERHYFDRNTGGFVLIHQNHNTSLSEIFIAEVLAKL